MNIDALTVTQGDGTNIMRTGLSIAGDADIEMVDMDLVSVEPIVIGGALDLELGTGCADLNNSLNDFNTVNIISAGEAEVVDTNNLSLTGVNVSDQALIVAVGDLSLDGNLTATNLMALSAFGSIMQNSGVIVTPGLMIETLGSAHLDQANEVGSAGTAGLFSAAVTNSLVFNNVFGTDVTDQSYTPKSGLVTTTNGLSANETCIHTAGLTVSSGTFVPGTSLLIDSSAGASIPAITAGDVVLRGTGDFDLSGANSIDRLAADIDGNLILNNEIDIEIADLTLCSVNVVGLGVTGDLDVTLSDDTISQSADVMVVGHSTFTLGTGNADLASMTNDFGSVEVTSSGTVQLGDANDLAITSSSGSLATFEVGGSISVDGDVTATTAASFTAQNGLTQTAGVVDTPTVAFAGMGDFSLTSLNDIGNGAPGNLGINITDGSLVLNNDHALHFVLSALVGAGTYSGDVAITTTNDHITQDAATPVIIGGTATFDVGTGDVCLEHGDGNADTVNDNDLNIVNILNATTAEIVDSNHVTINDANLTDRGIFESEFGDLNLTGTIISPNGLILLAGVSINQTSGTISTPEVLMDANGDANLGQINSIGNGAPGVVAGEAGGDFIVNSQYAITVDTVSLTRKDGTVVSFTGIDAAKIKIEALRILATAALTASGDIVLDSQDGFSQNANGVLQAAGIVLAGNGDFFLTETNQIGSPTDLGNFAAAVFGSIHFENLYGLLVASIACGPMTYVGVNLGTGGGTYSGDLFIDTTAGNGNVEQEADANIVVEGNAQFDVGTGDICLNKGDTDADTITNNDFSLLFVDAAGTVEIADINDISVEQISTNVTNALSIDAGGHIQLNDDIIVDNVHLKAGAGVSQQASTFIDSLVLILQGEGDFDLIERNRIGDIFTDGQLAADIAGSLTLLNDFDLLIDDLSYTFKDGSSINVSGVNIAAGASTGNFAVTTSNDDVGQTSAGEVTVAGLASFDVGVGCVGLTASGLNDFNEVTIIAADEAEIADGTDGMTVLDVTVDDQSYFGASGLLFINGTINSGSRFFAHSTGGALQSISSVITAQELIVQGTGNFRFEQANNIQNLGGLGVIAADVDGSFRFENTVATEVASLSYTMKDGSTTDIVGIDATGDFAVTLPDVDLTQASDAAVVVVGTSSFDVGTGCVDLTFGDENADTMNENNFGSIEIISASVVDIVDVDGFLIDDSVISDRGRFESETGTITIDRDLRATNQLMFVAGAGMTQNLGTNIEAPEVLFSGSGDFVLDQLNSIGNSGTPGQVAAAIDGSLELKNDFGINVASLQYLNKDASTVDIVGINIDNTTGSGNLTFDVNNLHVTQDGDAPVIATGLTTFDVGNSGTVNLPFADTMDDMMDVNENNFNQVAVDNADTVEFNDVDTVTIVGAFTNNRLSVTSDTQDIILDGNVTVGSTIKFDAQTGLSQTSGVVDTQSMILFGLGYFNFGQLNQMGNGVPGFFAADVSGDINLVNANPIQIDSLGYTDLNGVAHAATGVSSTGLGVLDSFRLRADGIQLHQRTVSNTVVFESTAGITQLDTITTDGLIDANDLSLFGSGFVNLAENNLIGSNFGHGDVAIDWAGDVRLKSLFGIDFDTVSFTFQSGAVRNDSGVTLVGQGGTAGNLELFAGGNITDAANIDVSIAGIASLIADDGNADIVLGDAFSNIGGPNNETHFGSVGFKAMNATVHEDSHMNLDGIDAGGNLDVTAFGHIVQTGNDPFSNVGTSAIEVEGHATFIVDNDTLATDHFNDVHGRDVSLLDRNDNELIDNLFAGGVTIAGTANTGGLNGSGTLRNVQFRNAAFEVSAFPTINHVADPLRSLTVWAPRSSAHINQDLHVLQNLVVFAGVDAVNGQVGGSLDVTNAVLNRKITDASGTEMIVGNNAIFEAGNTVILADNSTDVLEVGHRLQTSTHGGDAGSRIRVGISNSGDRGNDSGAQVTTDELRFRAKPTALADSEHASFNIDKGVEIVGPNVARSLMLIANGNITDDSDAAINVKNSTTLVAENDSDIMLGESFSTNFINNNVHNFGTLAAKGRNIDITEDSAILLDGINATGDFTITAMGHIRQSGQDRFGQIGTEFIVVGGDATFKVDQQQLPSDQTNDAIGQDVKIMATPQQRLMNNEIAGEVIITSTAVDGSQNGRGSVRNVEVRNVAANAKDPIINITASDRILNLQIWVPNNNLHLRNDFTVLNNFVIRAGIDSVNGLRNGRLQIVDNSAIRNLSEAVGVNLTVGNNADFRVANRMVLADNATDEFRVTNKATFITLGGGQGNSIDVGTNPGAPRGNDSGAIFETNVLKFRAPITGNFGKVTVVAESPVVVTADSQAKSAVVLP